MSSLFTSQHRISPSVASILKVVMIAVLVISSILVVGIVVGGCAEPDNFVPETSGQKIPSDAPWEGNYPTSPSSVTTLSGEPSAPSSVATLRGEPSAMIVGKWHSVKYADTMEFTADGKYTMTADAGSTDNPAVGTGFYRAIGWNLTITVSGGESATIPFTIEGDTVTFHDEIPEVYTRVR